MFKPSKPKKFLDKLQAVGLLDHFETLSDTQKENLINDIDRLDLDLFRRQYLQLHQPQIQSAPFEPYTTYFHRGNRNDHKQGEMLMREGKCAALVLAGGQASRLRCQDPKGCYPISSIKGKTLFELIAEKVRAASNQLGHPLELAIMTSPLNHDETETFFTKRAFFGLVPSQVNFFNQQMWPFLDFQGNLMLQGPDQIAWGPNGNGGAFRRLFECGIGQKWEKMGIEMIHVLPVDNPLALPFDQELFGFHQRNQCEVTIKASLRRTAQEKVGVISTFEGKPIVLEYTEKGEENQTGPVIANLGLYCFSLSFFRKMQNVSLPMHRAKKRVNSTESRKGWKFEEFIFDAFSLAERSEVLIYPRELCFAPLKNLHGPDSISAVQAAFLGLDRHVYSQVTGVKTPADRVFELAPEFYYPTTTFLKKWKNKTLPNQSYIED